jgi:hypothetical protein
MFQKDLVAQYSAELNCFYKLDMIHSWLIVVAMEIFKVN